MVTVNEEARSPPVRHCDVHLAIAERPTREFAEGSELTPPHDIGPIVYQGCVGPILTNKFLLVLMVLPRPSLLLDVREVEEGTPATAPDPVVFLDHPLKVRPCLLSELLDLKSG
jgi:hypothetical protein